LLSPACASFDMFKDFVERGEVFSSLVRTLCVAKQKDIR
jgi:UDP-N-acetylmuramoylalanine-D-glutamate ligase